MAVSWERRVESAVDVDVTRTRQKNIQSSASVPHFSHLGDTAEHRGREVSLRL